MVLPIVAAVSVLVVCIGLASFLFRRVVATNEVHIVQTAGKTVSYGKDTKEGNVYYEWPSFLPILGVSKIVLPVSVFDLDLKAYEAYDEGRLPFHVDVKAFFRITDSNTAAQRVASFQELENQLTAIVQGAVRTVLASHKLEEIMQGRSKFGEAFTAEVKEQLGNWGVETVKNIELMDIRDTNDSQVIHNIMSKKKSFIEMESRVEVAKNHKTAQAAEIEAQREVDLQSQVAKQSVGLRTVEAQQAVQLAEQSSLQKVKEAQRLTKEKEMAITQVQVTREADISREAALIRAEQDKKTAVLVAEGRLSATKLEAEGIKASGEAKADAEKALQLAPVQAQITLAKEIGGNQGYQSYLVTLEKVKATKDIGVEQAKALNKAEIKVIVQAGDPGQGLTKVMDLFSAKGGTSLGAMFEALSQTDSGKAILEKLGVTEKDTAGVPKDA